MKKILVVLMCFGLVGCATSQVLTDLKNAGRNSATVEMGGTVKEAKEIVREVATNWDIIERKDGEKDNYITFSSNFGKTMTQALFLGPFGAQTRRLGFFFEYDKENNVTTITIVEQNGDFVQPIRGNFVDKIKLRQLLERK